MPVVPVPDPDHRHGVAAVIAFGVLRARSAVADQDGRARLDAGLREFEKDRAARDGDEQVGPAHGDAAALAVAALRTHVVRLDVHVDVGRLGHEHGGALRVGVRVVVVDARAGVGAVPERVVGGVVRDLDLVGVGADRLEAGTVGVGDREDEARESRLL